MHFCVPNVSSRVTDSHLISAGGAIKAMDAVMKGDVDKAFAMVRPPGHHAQRVVYGDRGFCVVNVEAVMLERIRQDYGDLRVAIIDTDCHHGTVPRIYTGTTEIPCSYPFIRTAEILPTPGPAFG